MYGAATVLVWSVNLLVGAGLVLLGLAMSRRPERVWVGVRVARTDGEMERVRRANLKSGPWIVLLGAVDILSGPVALLSSVDPLMLAATGLVILLLAIAAILAAAVLAR